MHNIKNRFIALLMSLAMVWSAIPVNMIFAEEINIEEGYESIEIEMQNENLDESTHEEEGMSPDEYTSNPEDSQEYNDIVVNNAENVYQEETPIEDIEYIGETYVEENTQNEEITESPKNILVYSNERQESVKNGEDSKMTLTLTSDKDFDENRYAWIEMLKGEELDLILKNMTENLGDVMTVFPLWIGVLDFDGHEINDLGKITVKIETDMAPALVGMKLYHMKKDGSWEILDFTEKDSEVIDNLFYESYVTFTTESFSPFIFADIEEKEEEYISETDNISDIDSDDEQETNPEDNITDENNNNIDEEIYNDEDFEQWYRDYLLDEKENEVPLYEDTNKSDIQSQPEINEEQSDTDTSSETEIPEAENESETEIKEISEAEDESENDIEEQSETESQSENDTEEIPEAENEFKTDSEELSDTESKSEAVNLFKTESELEISKETETVEKDHESDVIGEKESEEKTKNDNDSETENKSDTEEESDSKDTSKTNEESESEEKKETKNEEGSEISPESELNNEGSDAKDISTHPLVEVEESPNEALLQSNMLLAKTNALTRQLGASAPPTQEPVTNDGMTIEKIVIKWLSKSNGSDVPAGYGTLDLRPTTDDVTNQQWQLDLALSGKHEHAVGTIEIVMPAYIWRTRDGKEPGILTLAVPEDPEEGGDFAWKRVGDTIVFTNTHNISAASKIMIQGTFRDVIAHEMVDMDVSDGTGDYARSDYADDPYGGYSDDLYAVVNVETPNGSTISMTSNSIDATISTYVRVASASKTAYNPSTREYYLYWEELPSNMPAELLPENPEDYCYVRWYISGSAEGNQPYTMYVEDTISDRLTYVTQDGDTGTLTAIGAKMLGVSGCSDGTVPSSDGVSVRARLFTGYNFDQKVAYVWTAYPKSSFPNEPFTVSTVKNTQTIVIEGADDMIPTTKEASANCSISPPLEYKVVKIWDDNDNEAGIRPKSQRIAIYYNKNGGNADSLWKYVYLVENPTEAQRAEGYEIQNI